MSSSSRQVLAFATPDLSTFAKALGRELKARARPEPPGHVEVLNLIARAAGHRNVQALRAALESAPAPAAPAPSAVLQASPELSDNARKALMQFDADGRLVRWPTKYSVQRLAMWVLWMRFEAQRVYTEKEVNAILKAANAFGDHVTLRRELINHRLLTRKSDCSEYRKLAPRADAETRALLGAWRKKYAAG